MRKHKRVLIILGLIFVFLSGCSRNDAAQVISSEAEKQEVKVENVQAGVSKDELNEDQEEKNILKEPLENSIEDVKEPIKEAVKENKPIKEIKGFVQVKDLDSSIVIDLKYATDDNFTHKKIYPVAVCLIRKETGAKLIKANEELKKQGYTLKVWDAYRPPYVQKILWNITPDKKFVANPYNGGSKHNRGSAVDITLVDSSGKEVEMPTKFDDFSSKAFRSNKNVSKEVKEHLELLTSTMKKCGFTPISSEWWHYDDIDYKKYPIIDVKLDDFLQ